MRLLIDDKTYRLSLERTVQKMRETYEQVSTNGLKRNDGSILRFGDRSLVRTGLKAIMTPIVIPFLQKIYTERGIILDPPAKHTDLIDYAVNAFLEFMVITERTLDVHLTSEVDEYSGPSIISISAAIQPTLTIESASD